MFLLEAVEPLSTTDSDALSRCAEGLELREGTLAFGKQDMNVEYALLMSVKHARSSVKAPISDAQQTCVTRT